MSPGWSQTAGELLYLQSPYVNIQQLENISIPLCSRPSLWIMWAYSLFLQEYIQRYFMSDHLALRYSSQHAGIIDSEHREFLQAGWFLRVAPGGVPFLTWSLLFCHFFPSNCTRSCIQIDKLQVKTHVELLEEDENPYVANETAFQNAACEERIAFEAVPLLSSSNIHIHQRAHWNTSLHGVVTSTPKRSTFDSKGIQ